MTNIKVYSRPDCPYCKILKDFLNEKKVEFTDIDVSSDEDIKKLEEVSGQTGVPVIDIDGKIIIGSDIDKIKEVLKID